MGVEREAAEEEDEVFLERSRVARGEDMEVFVEVVGEERFEDLRLLFVEYDKLYSTPE